MAQHVDVIMTRLNNFVDKQLTSLSQSNPMMAFAKPLITRVIDNNAYKVEGMLKQIADKDVWLMLMVYYLKWLIM